MQVFLGSFSPGANVAGGVMGATEVRTFYWARNYTSKILNFLFVTWPHHNSFWLGLAFVSYKEEIGKSSALGGSNFSSWSRGGGVGGGGSKAAL